MGAYLARLGGFVVVREIAFHALVSLLALGIAFSLPTVASYVLYEWWPRVAASSRLLLATELAFAATLLVLFHFARVAWDGVRLMYLTEVAALVHVLDDTPARWRRRPRPPASAREALFLSVTGFHTFVSQEAPFHELANRAYEVRAMLLNPFSEGARERIRSLADPAEAQELYVEEIGASIAHLAALARAGRRVRLKLYEQAPFWRIVVAGEQAWVRYCHDGYPMKSQPDYVFALRRDKPTQGLFPPFCMYALRQWDDPALAEYDFASDELVWRDAAGTETRREPFPGPLPPAPAGRPIRPPPAGSPRPSR